MLQEQIALLGHVLQFTSDTTALLLIAVGLYYAWQICTERPLDSNDDSNGAANE